MIENKIAKIITWVFNPLIMPTLGILLMLYSDSYLALMPFEGKRLVLIMVFACTFLIPMSFIPVLYYMKLISSFEMELTERVLPLFATAIVYFLTFFFLRKLPIPFINAFMLATAGCVLLNAIISLFWKISSHLIGIGGVVGLVATLYIKFQADVFLFLVGTVIVAGLLGFARLQLQKHTPAQIYIGFFMGFVLVSGFLLFV
jgi:hypothetical protein